MIERLTYGRRPQCFITLRRGWLAQTEKQLNVKGPQNPHLGSKGADNTRYPRWSGLYCGFLLGGYNCSGDERQPCRSSNRPVITVLSGSGSGSTCQDGI